MVYVRGSYNNAEICSLLGEPLVFNLGLLIQWVNVHCYAMPVGHLNAIKINKCTAARFHFP
jgi:hypothetical protein